MDIQVVVTYRWGFSIMGNTASEQKEKKKNGPSENRQWNGPD